MKFLYLLPALLLFGCTYYTETYAQYEGQQQNWPVSTGAVQAARSWLLPGSRLRIFENFLQVRSWFTNNHVDRNKFTA
jgi:hypothetical protein